MISVSVVDWYRRWSYEKETNTSLPYDKQSNRIIEAIAVYQSELNKYLSDRAAPKKKSATFEELTQWHKQSQ